MEKEPLTVLVTWSFTDSQLQRLQDVSPRIRVCYSPCSTPADVQNVLDATTEVLYTFYVPPDISRANRLKWLQLHSAGIDQIHGHPILDSRIMVTTTSGIHAPPVGEYVVGLALALARHLPLITANQHKHYWPPDRWTYYAGREIRGSTFGIVGYGSIGREIARLVHPMGARVLATNRSPEDLQDEGYVLPGVGDREGKIPERIYYGLDGLQVMLAQCDYMVISVPTTPQTRGLIGEGQLRAMKPEAFLINISRGGIVDEQALIKALRDHWIAGAALDVFAQEPLPVNHPLWEFKNVIVSPHVAGSTLRYEDRASELFAENLVRYLEGRELLNLLNRDRWY